MSGKINKLPKVTEYFCDEDQFSPGNACCPGCIMELNLRMVSRIMVKMPYCWAPLDAARRQYMARMTGHGTGTPIMPVL
jgi:hypothetical protein